MYFDGVHLQLVMCQFPVELLMGDEMHLIFECTALASLRSRYASLFTDTAGTMRSFFAQPDHIGVFHYVVDCLDFMMI